MLASPRYAPPGVRSEEELRKDLLALQKTTSDHTQFTNYSFKAILDSALHLQQRVQFVGDKKKKRYYQRNTK